MKLTFYKRILSDGWLVSIDGGPMLIAEVTGPNEWTLDKEPGSGPGVSGCFDDPRTEPVRYFKENFDRINLSLSVEKSVNKNLTGIIERAMSSSGER